MWSNLFVRVGVKYFDRNELNVYISNREKHIVGLGDWLTVGGVWTQLG